MQTSEIGQRVKNLFSEIDVATRQFACESKITCPTGCGQCCDNPEVETTVADMLPIAFALRERKELDKVAAKAEVSLNSVCVFFEKLESSGQSRCTVYPLRPSICRLFGFAAVSDKYGKSKLAFCKIHKQTAADVVENAKIQVEDGLLKAPLFSDFANQLSEIDPVLATQHYQINKALLLAIEKVALLPS